jgi:hypothetical protein
MSSTVIRKVCPIDQLHDMKILANVKNQVGTSDRSISVGTPDLYIPCNRREQ